MAKIVEKNLNIGHRRKLTALRKSLGPKIADKAFSKWLKDQSAPTSETDKYMSELQKAVKDIVTKGLKIPSSGIKISQGPKGIVVKIIKKKKKPAKRKAAKANPAKKAKAKKG
ncbi:MAG: hypothetical protein HQ513_14030 [Rhodospirillales bacterium]|nr:hypothetical protein [Rhodospirillales bacterium]